MFTPVTSKQTVLSRAYAKAELGDSIRHGYGTKSRLTGRSGPSISARSEPVTGDVKQRSVGCNRRLPQCEILTRQHCKPNLAGRPGPAGINSFSARNRSTSRPSGNWGNYRTAGGRGSTPLACSFFAAILAAVTVMPGNLPIDRIVSGLLNLTIHDRALPSGETLKYRPPPTACRPGPSALMSIKSPFTGNRRLSAITGKTGDSR